MDAQSRATHGAVAENSYLAGDAVDADPMDQLLEASITYRIAMGPYQGRKVFTLQTLPAWDESFGEEVGKVPGVTHCPAGRFGAQAERQPYAHRSYRP